MVGKGEAERGRKRLRRCSVFPSPDAPSRFVKLHSVSSLSLSFPLPPPLSPPYRLSLPIYISLSFSRLFSTIFGLLRLGPDSDPRPYLYDICVHYLAREKYTAPGFLRYDEPTARRAGEKTQAVESARGSLLYLRGINPASQPGSQS